MAAEAEVTWVAERRFIGHAASGHGIVVDGSADKLGPSPMELVLIGLAGCTAYDVLDILEKKKQAVTGLRVRAHAERAPEAPRVYTAIAVEFVVTGRDIRDKAVEDAIQLSMCKYCSVAQMLRSTAEINTSYRIEESTV